MRRRTVGPIATIVPNAISPPPSQTQSVIEFTAMPTVIRPFSFGDEMIVR